MQRRWLIELPQLHTSCSCSTLLSVWQESLRVRFFSLPWVDIFYVDHKDKSYRRQIEERYTSCLLRSVDLTLKHWRSTRWLDESTVPSNSFVSTCRPWFEPRNCYWIILLVIRDFPLDSFIGSGRHSRSNWADGDNHTRNNVRDVCAFFNRWLTRLHWDKFDLHQCFIREEPAPRFRNGFESEQRCERCHSQDEPIFYYPARTGLCSAPSGVYVERLHHSQTGLFSHIIFSYYVRGNIGIGHTLCRRISTEAPACSSRKTRSVSSVGLSIKWRSGYPFIL